MAPYFSGSQATLIRALQPWRDAQKPTIKIVNGSATELRSQLFVEAKLKMPESTVVSNKLMTQGILSYLAGCRDTDLGSNAAKKCTLGASVATPSLIP